MDVFYEQDPMNYLLYNIIDVVLINKLNRKLKHIEQHNTVRRLMFVPLTYSMRGSTAWYDTFVLKTISEQGKYVRYGIVNETGISVPSQFIKSILTPQSIPKGAQNIKWDVEYIDEKTSKALISHFPGAYVKNPPKKKLTNASDGIIIDLDASLPPYEKIIIRRNDVINYLKIEDYIFEKNDETITWSNTGKIYFEKVLAKLEHNYDGELITLTTETGKQITVTDNHSIFGVFKNKPNKTIDVIDAKFLEIGDFVVGWNVFKDESFYLLFMMSNMSKAYDNDIVLERIIKIEKQKYTGKVYDISVDNVERFFGGSGIGCHNSSLYPSMVLQCNISFDSYYGRIIDPLADATINILNSTLGSNLRYNSELSSSIYDFSEEYVKKLPSNKTKIGEHTQNLYLIIQYLFNKLKELNIPLKELFYQSNHTNYLILKQYVIPLLDLITLIHKFGAEYNTFCNDYILNNDISKYKHIYIVEDIMKPSIRITSYKADEINQYLKEKNLIITLSGALFYKQEVEPGLFIGFLKQLRSMRKEFQKLRDQHPKDSDMYTFYDMRQSSTKIIMNTCYGLYGQSTFRYSNKWLAQAITVQGRCTVKLAQIIGDMYLEQIKK